MARYFPERSAVVFLSLAGLFGLFPSSLEAGPIIDGGFEQPVVGPGGFRSGFQLFGVGSTFGSAWTVAGSPSGNVAIVPSAQTDTGGITFVPEEGSQSLDLTGNTDNGAAIGVLQSFATISGARYTLSFYLGDINNSAYPARGNASALVELNGSLFQTATNSNSSGLTPELAAVQLSHLHGPPRATTSVEFVNNALPGVGYNGLDNVVVTAADTSAPEPAPSLLLLTGVALLLLVRKRLQPS